MVRTLKKERNVAFIFITPTMDEVFQITDEITVLRDGQYVVDRPGPAIHPVTS
jgi:inositol transport system ATP-binding protein